jgi:NADPH:quinone reductase-like Zn-dependent oxidoreductase
MKAVVLHEYGPAKNLKWEEMPDPQAGEGRVLVRVHASSVNPIDYKLRSGVMKADMPLEFPAILGYDFAGVVQAVGPKVEGFKAGDRVFGLADKAYAELTAAKASETALIPGANGATPAIDLTTAAAIPLISVTGYQLMRDGAKAQKDQTILLTGAVGMVGRAALQAAKEAGAKVIAVVRAKQIDEALKLGATSAIDANDEAEFEKLGFVDAVADTVGGELATKLLAKVKQGGIFASVVGAPKGAELHPMLTISAVYSHADPKTFAHFAELVRDGKFALPIDRVLPMSDAAEGQAVAEKGGRGKIVLTA